MAGAFVASLAITSATLATLGTTVGATDIALQLTARWSYCFFLPAYAGGALAAVFGPAFQPLARRGRDLGLAFASAHLCHVALVAWLYYISPSPPVSTRSALYFGVAVVLTYVLALFSIPTLVAKLPPRAWWALRTFGMEYIALAFLRDFLENPFRGNFLHVAAYLPFIALAFAAALVRIAGYAKRLHRQGKSSPGSAKTANLLQRTLSPPSHSSSSRSSSHFPSPSGPR